MVKLNEFYLQGSGFFMMFFAAYLGTLVRNKFHGLLRIDYLQILEYD